MAQLIDLKRFDFTPHLDEHGRLLVIEGRKAGIIGAILDFLGISPRSSITVTNREVTFELADLSGIAYIVAPLDAITCSLSGVHKPLWQLFTGLLLVIGGLFYVRTALNSNLWTFVTLIGAVLIFFYIRTRHLTITFSTGDIGDVRGLAFNATSVGGKMINIETILEAIERINYLMVNSQSNNDFDDDIAA